MYRADRNIPVRSIDGVAILIRNKINHQHIPIPVLQSLEATAVLININNRSTLIVNTYQPPSRITHIADYDKVMNLYSNIIMAGDLNSNILIGDAVSQILTAINYINIFLPLRV